eukprot:scaffold204396_cov21-Tisochrysis_lutea.AAC.2
MIGQIRDARQRGESGEHGPGAGGTPSASGSSYRGCSRMSYDCGGCEGGRPGSSHASGAGEPDDRWQETKPQQMCLGKHR